MAARVPNERIRKTDGSGELAGSRPGVPDRRKAAGRAADLDDDGPLSPSEAAIVAALRRAELPSIAGADVEDVRACVDAGIPAATLERFCRDLAPNEDISDVVGLLSDVPAETMTAAMNRLVSMKAMRSASRSGFDLDAAAARFPEAVVWNESDEETSTRRYDGREQAELATLCGRLGLVDVESFRALDQICGDPPDLRDLRAAVTAGATGPMLVFEDSGTVKAHVPSADVVRSTIRTQGVEGAERVMRFLTRGGAAEIGVVAALLRDGVDAGGWRGVESLRYMVSEGCRLRIAGDPERFARLVGTDRGHPAVSVARSLSRSDRPGGQQTVPAGVAEFALAVAEHGEHGDAWRVSSTISRMANDWGSTRRGLAWSGPDTPERWADGFTADDAVRAVERFAGVDRALGIANGQMGNFFTNRTKVIPADNAFHAAERIVQAAASVPAADRRLFGEHLNVVAKRTGRDRWTEDRWRSVTSRAALLASAGVSTVDHVKVMDAGVDVDAPGESVLRIVRSV